MNDLLAQEAPLRVMIIDDDPGVRRALALALTDLGFSISEADSAETALHGDPAGHDLILLDVMLPGLGGLELCRRLREAGQLPIILVTARSDSADVIAGLEAGADDYVTKPVVAGELAARIRALLRRSRRDATSRLGDIVINQRAGHAMRGADVLPLTKTEFRLLCELVHHAGAVLSREHLLEQVWGYDYFGDTRLLDVHIRRLRLKVEPDPDRPRYIITVRGVGYRAEP